MGSIRLTLKFAGAAVLAVSATLHAQGATPPVAGATGLATEVGGFPRGAPGTGASPIAFGANWGDIYAGALWQAPKRHSTASDAGAGIGFGLADAHDIFGLELNLVPLTTVVPGATNSVQFAAKVHKILPGDWGIAAGVQNVYLTNAQNKATIFGVVSKVFDLEGTNLSTFKSITFSAGVGNEAFRLEKDSLARNYTVGAFGSVALRVLNGLSVVVDWPGQDLNAGLVIAPIAGLPLVITPSIVDVTGSAGTHNYGSTLARPRFNLGTGFVVKF